MNNINEELFNSRGELIYNSIDPVDNIIYINSKMVGRIFGNKVVVNNEAIATVVKRREGIVILNDEAFDVWKEKNKQQRKLQKEERQKRITRINIALIIGAMSLGALVSGILVGNFKNRQMKNLIKKMETDQSNKSLLDEYLNEKILSGKLTASALSIVTRPLEDTSVEDLDDSTLFISKLLLADYLGLDENAACRMTYHSHYEKADDEYIISITLRDEYGNEHEIAHTNSLDELGQKIVMIGQDGSMIKPEIARRNEKECKQNYINRIADCIIEIREKQDSIGEYGK